VSSDHVRDLFKRAPALDVILGVVKSRSRWVQPIESKRR
jgi:hypothetical protein